MTLLFLFLFIHSLNSFNLSIRKTFICWFVCSAKPCLCLFTFVECTFVGVLLLFDFFFICFVLKWRSSAAAASLMPRFLTLVAVHSYSALYLDNNHEAKSNLYTLHDEISSINYATKKIALIVHIIEMKSERCCDRIESHRKHRARPNYDSDLIS